MHGLKYWFNYKSKDLLHFEPQGTLLKPDTKYDSHGVYSGSAFEYQNHLIICIQAIIVTNIGIEFPVK